MKILNAIALTLVMIGGLNWGLIGLFGFNLVTTLFGANTILANIIYILVGMSALYCIALFKPLVHAPEIYQPHASE